MKKLIIIIITLLIMITPVNAYSQPLSSSNQKVITTQLYQLINQQRSSKVKLYSRLSNSTSLRAKEIMSKWSHTRPNKTRWNTTIKNIINIKKVPHGENLAKITVNYKKNYTNKELQRIAKQIHQSLVKSPTHYKVMTNKKYHKVYIGIYSKRNNNKLTITIAQHYIK